MELFRSAILRKRGSGASQLAPSCPQTSPARPIFLCCLWHGLKDLLRFCFAFNPPRAELCPLGGVPCLVGGGRGQRPHPACLVPRSRSASRLKSPRPLPCHGKCPLPSAAPSLGLWQAPSVGPPPLRYGDQPLASPCPRQSPHPNPEAPWPWFPAGPFPLQGRVLGWAMARRDPNSPDCSFAPFTGHLIFEPDRLTRLKLTSSEYAINNLPTGKGVTAQPSTAASRTTVQHFLYLAFGFPCAAAAPSPR